MGQGGSKPETLPASKHEFQSHSPTQFASPFVDGLQSNTETDAARSKTLEKQIQARVAQELERLRAREQQTLAEIEKKLGEIKDSGNASSPAALTPAPSVPVTSYYPAGSLDLDAPRIPFAGREYTPAPPAAVETAPAKELSHQSVNADIEELRVKLEGRKKLAELSEPIAKAQKDVISCLRVNDRRPLDCWKEVADFKREVAKLEEGFVDRIVG
ncbi:hypothetical protein BDV19DRAFT_364168 [Aspergillus venezuelensis]